MNYSNGKPIGCNYSGEQASGSGFGTIGRCTIGMTFEELQESGSQIGRNISVEVIARKVKWITMTKKIA